MYYRVAIQPQASTHWRWASTVLSSLDTTFRFLRLYRALPQDRLRVFSSASRASLHEQLAREKSGEESLSVTAAQFLRERLLSSLEEGSRAAPAQQTREGQKAASSRAIGSSLASGSDTRSQRAERVYGLDHRRLEVEQGTGGDHDLPYRFTLPHLWLETLAWVELHARVKSGKVKP
jgi:hypothetical protein